MSITPHGDYIYILRTTGLEKYQMSEYTVKAEKLSLPLVALNTTVAFPGEVINLEIDDSNFGSCDALREAFEGSKYAVAIPIKDSEASEPILFEVGTVIKIKQLINAGEKTLRCIAEGMSRAMVSSYRRTGKYHTAEVICKTVILPDGPGIKNEAYLRRLYDRYGDWSATLAAYNAGPGRVDAWLDDPAMLDEAGRLDPTAIPTEETRRYVPAVLDAMRQYDQLYAQQNK